MASLDKSSFFIEEWQVLPAQGTLRLGDTVVHLEPKAMEVLVYLAGRAGQVITRNELERDVWHGALVGYDAVTNTVIKLRKALGDDSRKPRFISTIPKKGYQLICEVSINTARKSTSTPVHDNSKPGSETPQPARPRKLGLVVVSISAVAILAWFSSFDILNSAHRPSIAVLPFQNLNVDKKQDYLADGITEDITTDLSKLHGIQVIASNTASASEYKKETAHDIGKKLGVTYVLRGTIRRLGDHFRVNVELVDTATGFNSWANRYDRNVKDFFAVQDDVTHKIVQAMSVRISKFEETRIARNATNSLKAYDYFQAGQKAYRTITREGDEQARQAYRKAIQLDPAYGRAYGAMATTLAMDYRLGWTDAPEDTLSRALELAKKAVSLDPTSPQTYWALGFVQLTQKNYAGALNSARQSITIAPNFADGYGLLGVVNSFMGDADQAIKFTRRGMQLNPYYTWEYLFVLGQSYYMLGEYNKAIVYLEQAQSRNETVPQIKVYLAACYEHVGRGDDAMWIISQVRLVNPSTTISSLDKSLPVANPAIRATLMADLRRAGLPQ